MNEPWQPQKSQDALVSFADGTYNTCMKIFLSYDDRDRECANDLASRLSDAGYEVWYSADRILPGDNWALEMSKALEKSDAMLVVLSPAALSSSRVLGDISFALSSTNYSDRLIPVQVATVTPESVPWILRKMKLIRYGRRNQEKAIQQIIERLERAPV